MTSDQNPEAAVPNEVSRQLLEKTWRLVYSQIHALKRANKLRGLDYEDVAHEACLRVLKYGHNYDPAVSSPANYVATIVRGTVAHMKKSRAYREMSTISNEFVDQAGTTSRGKRVAKSGYWDDKSKIHKAYISGADGDSGSPFPATATESVRLALAHMNRDDREILETYALRKNNKGGPHSLQAIAKRRGVSKQRIGQLQTRAIQEFKLKLTWQGVDERTAFEEVA